MDIKEKLSDIAEEITEKLKSNPALLKQFKENPVKALESVLGKDLPDEKIEKIVSLIKAKLMKEEIEDKVDDIGDKLEDKADDIKDALKGLGGLFGKK